MPEVGGFEYVVQKVKDEGKKEYVDVAYPYGDIKRGAFKGTFTTPGDKKIHSVLITAGKQLKLLFLRVSTAEPAGAWFKIVQVGQPGDLGSAPAGTVDYPMLESAGSEVLGHLP